MSDTSSLKAPDAFRTISEVAEDLDLPQHVLRFWETRFTQIKPMKRGGGRRYYRPEDINLLRGIRTLLYSEGFTIRGVQRLLKERGMAYVLTVGQAGFAYAEEAPDALEDRHSPETDLSESSEVDFTHLVDEGVATRPPVVARLDPGARRQLQAALADLTEAQRLLESR